MTTTGAHLDSPPSPASSEEMRRLLAAELSPRARLGYVGLLLAAVGVTASILSLWVTEPRLPLRTHLAFGLIVAIGLAWVAYATWVLRKRRVLLAGHRIVAARMAVGFSALFVVASLAVGIWGPPAKAPFAAAGLGVAMLAAAAVVHWFAGRRFRRLIERRRELEAQIRGRGN